MKKIGIFCSASANIDKMYFDSTRQPFSTYYEVANTLDELKEIIK